MSFTTRQQQGKKRTARPRDRKKAAAFRWYLCKARHTCACANTECHGRKILRRGADIVYRAAPKTILCPACADELGIHYRPSLAWEAAHENTSKRRVP